MTLEAIRSMLGWCTLINTAFLIVWFLFFTVSHDLVYRMHAKWFNMSVEKFDEIHYHSIAMYKAGIFLFTFAPYLALRIMG